MSFFEKYKKIIFAAGFLLVVFIFGYLIYSTFFKGSLPAPGQPNNQPAASSTPAGELPTSGAGTGQVAEQPPAAGGLPQGGATNGASPIADGGLTQTATLNQAPSLGVTMGSDGSGLQYYNQADGKFYRIDKDGNATPLSDHVFYDVQQITWSPAKDKAILAYPDGAKIVYDFTNNKQVTLPSHWKDFDFSPSGSQIVLKSMGVDPDNRWLAVANNDGSKAKLIEAIGDNEANVYPSWSPNNQIVAMYTQGVDFDRQEVFFVGQNNENFKSTVVEGRGFEPKWDPAGDKLLYSVYSSQNGLKPSLWIVNAQGDAIGSGRKDLGVDTWAHKCTFAQDSLYCAVPDQLENGAGLFPELAAHTNDLLYRIDPQTGLKKLVAIPDGKFNMSNLMISDNGYYLYFTDGNNILHKIKLK